MMTNLTLMVDESTPEFLSWLAGAEKVMNDYSALHFPNAYAISQETLEFTVGPKFIRIIRKAVTKEGGSAHAFIDRTNGDVLKPASWKTPAKHARGNIFDAHNGLGSMGPYGPAYLK